MTDRLQYQNNIMTDEGQEGSISTEEGTDGGEANCRWCLSPMPVDAVVCSACTRHQSKFWNTAPNISLLFALLAAIFSGGLFIYTQSVKIISEVTWKDNAEIWKLDTIGESFVRNIGDGDIFVSSIEISETPMPHSFEVGLIVKKGALEVARSNFNPIAGRQFRPLSQQEITDGVAPTIFVYLSDNAATLASWRRLLSKVGKTLSETPAKAVLEYYSLRDNSMHTSEVVCIAVPLYITE